MFSYVDVESKLLKARMRMQQKYLDQFYMLYDDFHITKLPLLPEEVNANILGIFKKKNLNLKFSLRNIRWPILSGNSSTSRELS